MLPPEITNLRKSFQDLQRDIRRDIDSFSNDMMRLEGRIDALHTKVDMRWEYQKEWVEKGLAKQREASDWMDTVTWGVVGLAIVVMAAGAFAVGEGRGG